MNRLTLKLTLKDRVVFSQNASTEGDHKTLDFIPGSVLLGWCASQIYNKDSLDDAFTIFHSGNVRFSNGLPITNEGYPCFPIPNNLMEPKHEGGGIENNKLTATVSIGRPPQGEKKDVVQYEAIKNKYLSPQDLKIVEPLTGRQLKNAQPRKESPEGQLYGYSHLEAGQSFVATIEGRDIDDEDWQLIKNCFEGQELYLGRSKAIEYGGSVSTEVLEGYSLWPTNQVDLKSNSELCIWVLSDLAILDHQTSLPTLSPTLKDLFPKLDQDSELNKSKSVVGHRRYAPWNGKLQMRDVEKSVITAGSVLYYSLDARDASQSLKSDAVGLYQEAGLGRIWVNPDVLSGVNVCETKMKFGALNSSSDIQSPVNQNETASDDSSLKIWMISRYNDSYLENLDERINKGKKELDEIYGYLKRVNKQDKFPSKAQWSQVAEIVRVSKDRNDLETKLFDPENGICRSVKNNNTNVETEWGVTVYLADWEDTKTLSEWLEGQISIKTSDKDSNQMMVLSPSLKSHMATIANYAKLISSGEVMIGQDKEGVLSDD